MSDHLRTRLVFIDTSAYEDKNFQFGQYALEKLEGHLKDSHLHLLITSITINETLAHMREKSKEAKSLIKKFQKDAMYLRNVPDLPCFGVFNKVDDEEIYLLSKKKFDNFLKNGNVELVDLSGVDIQHIFNSYFESSPPFGGADKKAEFPDAFCLEAVKNIAQGRHQELYVISKDKDMENYVESTEGLHHLQNIDDLLDLVVRTELQLEDPAKLAQYVNDNISEDIIRSIRDFMGEAEFYSDGMEGGDSELHISKIEGIKITHINIIDASREVATFEVRFDVTIEANYSYADYDRSPWDPEDREYVFVLHNSMVKKHFEQYSCYVTVNLHDGLLTNAQVESVEIDATGFDLTDHKSEVISYREFDINGD